MTKDIRQIIRQHEQAATARGEKPQRPLSAETLALIAKIHKVAQELGGKLAVGQANEFLRQLTGVEYTSNAEEPGQRWTPLYMAIERGLLRTSKVGDRTYIDVSSFVAYILKFAPRRDKSD